MDPNDYFETVERFEKDSAPSSAEARTKFKNYLDSITNEALPPIEQIPKPYQDFISSLGGHDDFEKVQLIHQFVIDTVKPVPQNSDGESIRPFVDFAKNPTGDCDDYARMNSALMRYADVDMSKSWAMVANVRYSKDGKEFPPETHIMMTYEDDGKFYAIDNNMRDMPVISPQGTSQGYGNGYVPELQGANTSANYSDMILVYNMHDTGNVYTGENHDLFMNKLQNIFDNNHTTSTPQDLVTTPAPSMSVANTGA